jgi:hypothetical protein
VIALGKKIVLIEGEENSLDKKVYSHLTKSRFQNLVVLPARGKDQVAAFGSAVSGLLGKAIWGVDFYMLCDRDAVPFGSAAEKRLSTQSKVELLPRYHLENYFLDSETIAASFRHLEAEDHWLRNAQAIELKLKEIATELVPYAAALWVSRELRLEAGNIDVMPSGTQGKTASQLVQLVGALAKSEGERINIVLTESEIGSRVERSFSALTSSLDSDDWKRLIPGKLIVARFCSLAKMPIGRFINLYLNESETRGMDNFREIIAVLEKFSR